MYIIWVLHLYFITEVFNMKYLNQILKLNKLTIIIKVCHKKM